MSADQDTHQTLRAALASVEQSESNDLNTLLGAAGVDLSCAFRQMDIDDMDFSDVDIDGFDFTGCDISGVDFSTAKNVELANFDDVTYARGVPKFPGGLEPENAFAAYFGLRDLTELLDDPDGKGAEILYSTAFFRFMMDRIPHLASMSHDPEHALDVAQGAILSLSLNHIEIGRVLKAVPNLSTFQLTELGSIFEEETVKFKELCVDSPDEIWKLALNGSAGNLEHYRLLTDRYMSTKEARKLGKSLLDLVANDEKEVKLRTAYEVFTPQDEAAFDFFEGAFGLRDILHRRKGKKAQRLLEELDKTVNSKRRNLLINTRAAVKGTKKTLPDLQRVEGVLKCLGEDPENGTFFESAEIASRELNHQSMYHEAAKIAQQALERWDISGLADDKTELRHQLEINLAFSLAKIGQTARAVEILKPRCVIQLKRISQEEMSISGLRRTFTTARLLIVFFARLGKFAQSDEVYAQIVSSALVAHAKSSSAVEESSHSMTADYTEVLLIQGRHAEAYDLGKILVDIETGKSPTSKVMWPFLFWISGGSLRFLHQSVKAASQRGQRSQLNWNFYDTRLAVENAPPEKLVLAAVFLKFVQRRASVKAMQDALAMYEAKSKEACGFDQD